MPNRSISPLLALLLTGALLSACAKQPENPEPQPQPTQEGTVQGRVVAARGSPLVSGAVRVAEEPVGVPDVRCTFEGTQKSATTDASGTFTFHDVGPGSYLLICRKSASDGKAYSFLRAVEVTKPKEVLDLGALEIRASGAIRGVARLLGQQDMSGIVVAIPGTSLAARTDGAGAYLLDGVPSGTHVVAFERQGYTPTRFSNITVQAGETTAMEAVLLQPSTGASGSLSLNEGKPLATARTVAVTLSASDGTTVYQLSESESFLGAQWKPLVPRVEWTFSADGRQKLYARFADAGGLPSAPVVAELLVDTLPPSGFLQFLAGPVVNTRAATLTLQAQDATSEVVQMRLGTSANLDAVAWEPFAATRAWTLSETDGAQTVYAQFRDAAGHTSEAVSASVVLDTTPPSGLALRVDGSALTGSRSLALRLSASGATEMVLSEDPSFASAPWKPFSEQVLFELLSSGDGEKTVHARFRDAVGNVSESVSTRVTLDTQPPTRPTLATSSAVTREASFRVALTTASTDPHLQGYQLRGGSYTHWTDTQETNDFLFTFPAEGEHTLQVRAIDQVGNVSPLAQVLVRYDKTPPTVQVNYIEVRGTTTILDWETNEPATSEVVWSTTPDFTSSQVLKNDNLGTIHRTTLSGLSPHTTYWFKLLARDDVGNSTTEARAEYTFRTVTEVAGNITANTTWTRENGPYLLTDKVQVAPGVTLTVQPGVHIQGAGKRMDVFGQLDVVGTSAERVVLDHVLLYPGINAQAAVINVDFAEVNGGTLWAATGSSATGTLQLRNSVIRGLEQYVYLWYPKGDCAIERNVFIDSGGLSLSSGPVSVSVRNNVFHGNQGDGSGMRFAIEVWNGDPSTLFIEHNSFLSTDRVAVALEYDSATASAVNNYWGTSETATIEAMIHDQNDDFSLAGKVPYTPFLTAPHAETPDPTPWLK